MGSVVVDSSVILALWDPSEPLHQAVQPEVRRRRASGLRVPAVVWSEVLVGAARENRLDQALHRLRQVFGRPRAIDENVAIAAAVLRAKHRSLRTPDALVIATGEVDECEVLTCDGRLARVDARVTVVNAPRRRG